MGAMLCAGLARADEALPRYANDWRSTVDVAARSIWSDSPGPSPWALYLGLDIHRVFSDEQRDIGTLTLQPYLTRIGNMASHPPFFDGPNDTQLVYRIFNFNLTRYGGGRTNVRLGHFEIPFGLEQVVNTNGTIRDFMHGPNLGVKADWGVSLNGELPQVEYEVALTRGSGNNWETRGSPYAWSGRVGTSRARNLALGLSFLDGRLFDAQQSDFTTRRTRLGIDAIWYVSRASVLAEWSMGKDETAQVRAGLLEIALDAPTGSWRSYLQTRLTQREQPAGGTLRETRASLGVRVVPDNHWSVDVQVDQPLDLPAGAARSTGVAAQLRYRL